MTQEDTSFAPESELEPTPVVSGQRVAVSSLPTLQLFRYKGHVYTKRQVRVDGVRALSQRGKLVTLSPDTMVEPV